MNDVTMRRLLREVDFAVAARRLHETNADENWTIKKLRRVLRRSPGIDCMLCDGLAEPGVVLFRRLNRVELIIRITPGYIPAVSKLLASGNVLRPQVVLCPDRCLGGPLTSELKRNGFIAEPMRNSVIRFHKSVEALRPISSTVAEYPIDETRKPGERK